MAASRTQDSLNDREQPSNNLDDSILAILKDFVKADPKAK